MFSVIGRFSVDILPWVVGPLQGHHQMLLPGPGFPSLSGSCIPKTQGRCPYNLPHSQPTKPPRLGHCLIIHQNKIPTFARPPVPTFTRSQVSKLQDSQASRFLDSHDSQAGRLSHYQLVLSLPGPQIQSGRVPGSTESPAGWEAPAASPLTPDPSPV